MSIEDTINRRAAALGITAKVTTRPYRGAGEDTYLSEHRVAEIGRQRHSGENDAGALIGLLTDVTRVCEQTRETLAAEVRECEARLAALHSAIAKIDTALSGDGE